MKNEHLNQEREHITSDRNAIQEKVLAYAKRVKLKKVIAILCVVVMLFTINSLKFKGVTLEHTATCGLEEHVHGEGCYDEEGNLICGLEEHVHTDACFQERPKPEPTVLDEYVDLNSQVVLASPMDDGSSNGEVTSDNIEDEVGEIEVELGGDDGSGLTVEYEDEPAAVEEAKTPEYNLNGGDVAFLSDVLNAVEGNIENIVSVGELQDSVVSAVGEHITVEPVEGIENEFILRVTKSFDQIELCVVGDEIITLALLNGVAVEQPAPAPVEESSVVEDEQIVEEINTNVIEENGNETTETELKQTEVGNEQTEVEDAAPTAVDENPAPASEGSEAVDEDAKAVDEELGEVDGELVSEGNEADGEDKPAAEDETADGDASVSEDGKDEEEPVSEDESAVTGDDDEQISGDEEQVGGDESPAAKTQAVLDFSDYAYADQHEVYLYDSELNAVLVKISEIASADGVEATLPEDKDAEDAEDATLIITGDGEYEMGDTVYTVTGLVLAGEAAPSEDAGDEEAAPAGEAVNEETAPTIDEETVAEQTGDEATDSEEVEDEKNQVILDFSNYVVADDHEVYLYDGEMKAVLVNVSEIASVDGVEVTMPESTSENDDEDGEADEGALIITADGEYEMGGKVYVATGLVLEEDAPSEEDSATADEENTSAPSDDEGADEQADEETVGEAPEEEVKSVVLDFADYIATDDHTAFLYDSAAVAVMVNVDEIASVDGVEVSIPNSTNEDEVSKDEASEDEAPVDENDEEAAQAATLVITDNGEYELNGVVYTVKNLILPVAKVENDTITISTSNEEATLLNVAPVFEETDEDYDDIFSLFAAAQDDPTLIAKLADALFGVAYAEETEVRTLQMKLFNIGLQDVESGEEVEPGTSVHIETSFEGISGEDFKLYHIVDGRAELVNDAVVVEDGEAVGFDFYIDSLSPFALVYYTVTTETGETYKGYSYKTNETALNAQGILDALGIEATADSVSCSDETVVIDGLDIILPEGFTKAVLTIVAGIDHYEVTLLAQDELEAAAGDYSVALDLSEAGLDEDRIYKVEIDQAPATEEQVAAVEAALSEELEGGIRKIAHVSDLEMVDISIIDIQTGEAVEPSGPVAVELKKGGETVPTVVHFKGDGSVETLEVEDGRFVTESFSEFTGSYTVDFEYVNPETGEIIKWSFPGLGSYKLSDILAVLGIEGEITTVTLTREENRGGSEKVLYIEEKEDGWYLTSDEAFDDVFVLAVVVDEVKYVLIVTDVQETTDLSQLITAFYVEGATRNADGSYTVKPGKPYNVKLSFTESDTTYQFSNSQEMTYTLPEGLVIGNPQSPFNMSVNILGVNYTIAGNTLDIGADGRTVKIKFNTSDPNFSKLQEITTATFDVNASVTFGERPYDNPITVTGEGVYHVDTTPDASIEKTHKLVNFDTGVVEYTLKLTSNGQNSGIEITDTITGDALTFNPSSVRMYQSDGTTEITSGYTVSNQATGFTMNTGALANGVYYIKYTATLDKTKLDEDPWNNGALGMQSDTNNHVTWTGDKSVDHNIGHVVSKPWFKKEKVSDPVTDANGKATITWKITALSNYKDEWRLRNVTDAIQSEGMHYSGDGIHVTITDQTTNQPVVTDQKVTWSTIGIDPTTDTTWTYDMNKVRDNAGKLWKYEIVYTTEYDASNLVAQTEVSNDSITNYDPNPYTGTVTVQPPEANRTGIYKENTAIDIDNNPKTVTWKIKLDIPARGVDAERAKVIEYLPTTGSYQDSYVADSFRYISGNVAADGDPSIDTSVDGQVTFSWTSGFAPQSDRRQIVFEIKTTINEDWYADESVTNNHKNHAEFNNGHGYADAEPPKPMFKKSGSSLYQSNGDYCIDYTVVTNKITAADLNGGPITFTDTYDERLEYVGGSARLFGGDDKYSIGYGEFGVHVPSVSIDTSTNTISFTIAEGNLPKKDIWDQDTQTHSYEYWNYYKLYYRMRVKDIDALAKAAMNSTGFVAKIENRVDWGTNHDEVTIDYTPDVLNKYQASEADSSGRIKFVIEVNKARMDLFEGNELTLTDTLTNLSASYQDIEIDVKDYSTPVMGVDGSGAPVTLPYYNMRGDTITFYLPDEHEIIITYYAKAVGEADSNGMIHYRNVASLNGYEKSVDNWAQYKTMASGSGTNYGVVLYKVNGYVNSQALEGAVFKLYIADEVDENGNIVSGTPMKDIYGNDVTFTCGSNGQVEVKGTASGTGWNLKPEQRYYLVEVQAPTGCAIDNTKYGFLISKNGYVNYSRNAIEAPDGSGAIIQPWTYFNGDVMTVKDYPIKGVLKIEKVLKDAEDNTISASSLDADQKAAIRFVIYKLNTSTNAYEVFKTVGYDEFITDTYTIADLDAGTYKVVETIGEDQYVSKTTYAVTKNSDEADNNSGLATIVLSTDDITTHAEHGVTITNTYDIPSQFRIFKYVKYKQSASGGDLKDIKLAGAEFGVFEYNTSTGMLGAQIGENYITNSRGRFVVTPLDNSSFDYDTVYALKEVKAPTGYQLSDQVYYFVFCGQSNTGNTLPSGAPEGTVPIPYKGSETSDIPNEVGTTEVGVEKIWLNEYLETDTENTNSVSVKVVRKASYDKAGNVPAAAFNGYYPDITFRATKDSDVWKLSTTSTDDADVLTSEGLSIDSTTGKLKDLPTMTFDSDGLPIYYSYTIEEQATAGYTPAYSYGTDASGASITTITNKPSSVTSFVKLKAEKKWVDDAGNDVTADMGYGKSVTVDVYRKSGLLEVGTIIDGDVTVRELSDQFTLPIQASTTNGTVDLATSLLNCMPGDTLKVTIWPTEKGGSWNPSTSKPTVEPYNTYGGAISSAVIDVNESGYIENERYEYSFTIPVGITAIESIITKLLIRETSGHTGAMKVQVENLTATTRRHILSQAEAAVAGGTLVQTLELNKQGKWKAESREFPAGSGSTAYTYYLVERGGSDYDATYSIDDSTKSIVVTNTDKKLKVDKKWFNAYGDEITRNDGQIVYKLYQVPNTATWSTTYSGEGNIKANIANLYWYNYQNNIINYSINQSNNIKEGSDVTIEFVSDTPTDSNISLKGVITIENATVVSDQYITVRDSVEYVEDVIGDSGPTHIDYLTSSHKRVIKISNIQTGFAVRGSVYRNGNSQDFTASIVVTGEPGTPTPSGELTDTQVARVTMSKDSVSATFSEAFADKGINISAGATDWSSIITGLPEVSATDSSVTYTYYITEESVDGFELMSIDTVPASAASSVVIKNKKEPLGNLTVKKVVIGATGQKSRAFKVTVTTVVGDVTYYAKADGTLTTTETILNVSENQDLVIDDLPLGTYTVTEITGTAVQIDGYYFVSNTVDPAGGSVSFTRSDPVTREQMEKTVKLTNTYVKAVDVTKVWGNGVTPRNTADPIYFALYTAAKGTSATLAEVTDSEQAVTADTAWKGAWRGMDFEHYDYFIVEYVKNGEDKVYDGQDGWPYDTSYNFSGTRLTPVQVNGINYYRIGEYTQDSVTFKLSSLTAVNNNPPVGSLNIQKTTTLNGVTDSSGSLNGTYSFTVGDKTDPTKTAVVDITVENGVATYAALNGTPTITGAAVAVASGVATLNNLPAGTYTVTENLTAAQTTAGIVLASVALGETPATNGVEVEVTANNTANIPTAAFVNDKPYVEVNIPGTKVVENDGMGTYSFTIAADETNATAPMPAATTVSNDVSGGFTFGPIAYKLSDLGGASSKTFKYNITETAGSDTDMVYDSNTIQVTVTVTKDADGKLSAKVDKNSSAVQFTNKRVTRLPVEKTWQTADGSADTTVTNATVKSVTFTLYYQTLQIKDASGNTVENATATPAAPEAYTGNDVTDKTVTVVYDGEDASKNWKGAFENLPKYLINENGKHEYLWTAKETQIVLNDGTVNDLVLNTDEKIAEYYAVTGNLTTASGAVTVANRRQPTSHTVSKAWSGYSIPEGYKLRVTYQLHQTISNGTGYVDTNNTLTDAEQTVTYTTISDTAAVAHTWQDLEKWGFATVDDTTYFGEFKYYAVETKVELLNASDDSLVADITSMFTASNNDSSATVADHAQTITNTQNVKRVKVKKQWQKLAVDGSTYVVNDNKVGPEVSFTLYQKYNNGTSDVENEITTVVLDGQVTASDQNEVETATTLWQYTWPDQPAQVVVDGHVYNVTYEVRETVPSDASFNHTSMTSAVDETDTLLTVFTAVNRYTEFEVEKQWKSVDGQDIQPEDGTSITLRLYRSKYGEDGNLVADSETDIDTVTFTYHAASGSDAYVTRVHGSDTENITDSNAWWTFKWDTLPVSVTEDNVTYTYKYVVKEDALNGYNASYVVNNSAGAQPAYTGSEVVTNTANPGYELPSTGGPGTSMFYILGSILSLVAAVLLITKKRSDGARIE